MLARICALFLKDKTRKKEKGESLLICPFLIQNIFQQCWLKNVCIRMFWKFPSYRRMNKYFISFPRDRAYTLNK